MFIKKEEREIQTGIEYFTFCNNCGSQEVETISTCKKCGSHHIIEDLYDERSEKPIREIRDIYIFMCDCCGKKFEMSESLNNSITYIDGKFFNGVDARGLVLSLEGDFCKGCKEKIIQRLTRDIYTKVANRENVLKAVEKEKEEYAI